MIIKKLIQTRRADAELSTEIRAALIESLFAPISSLIVGAVGCAIVGALVAARVGDPWIMANSIAILAVGMLRVASALLYRKCKSSNRIAATKVWERIYEYGAWGFSGLLGLLCWLTITKRPTFRCNFPLRRPRSVTRPRFRAATPDGPSSQSASSHCARCQWRSHCSFIPTGYTRRWASCLCCSSMA